MTEQKIIPAVQVPSGRKFVNDKGITAIKDGIKEGAGQGERLAKPDWLRIRIQGGATYEKVHDIVREHRLAGGHLVSAQSGQNVLTSFYKTAAELAGIKLTAHEIEFTKKVLEVNVVAGDDDARTAIADQIEAEDRAAEEARRKRENRRFPRCVSM